MCELKWDHFEPDYLYRGRGGAPTIIIDTPGSGFLAGTMALLSIVGWIDMSSINTDTPLLSIVSELVLWLPIDK